MPRLRHINKQDQRRDMPDQELVGIINHNRGIRVGDSKEEDHSSSNRDIDHRLKVRLINKVLLVLVLNNRISMDRVRDLNNHTHHLIQVVRHLIDITHLIHLLQCPCRKIDHINPNPCLVPNLEDLVHR
jgi:hypothetical protein